MNKAFFALAVLAAGLVPPSACAAPPAPAAETVFFENWSEETATMNIAEDGVKGWIHAMEGGKKGRFLAMVGAKNVDLSKVRTGFREGRLVFDTTEADFSAPDSFVQILFAMPLADIPKGPKIDFAVEMKATPGTRWKVGHSGHFTEEAAPFDQTRKIKRTHYWNNRQVVAEDAAVRPCVYSRAVPAGLKGISLDIRLESPGAYEIGKVSWGVATEAETPVDPKRNLVVNGGAERGWYGTAMASTITYSETGKYLGQDGHWFTTSIEPAIDTEERHSGRASFRFHIDHDRESIPAWGPYNMEFNAIPVVAGKPLAFTCWAKADRDGRRLSLRLKAENGGSYTATLKLTTEWKRYRLLVRSVGEKQNGGFGDLGMDAYGLYVPRLDFVSPGTFWVDDCGVFQAEDGDYELEPICASGRIDKDSAVYYAGERIAARLDIAPGACEEGRALVGASVSSKALDYRGRVVAETPERRVRLDGGAARFEEELHLPAEFRGPVQWLFTVRGAGGGAAEQTVGFNLGVIDGRKPLLKRFGYNIYHDGNIPRIIELFKDFRVGSVRIWDDNLRTERHIEEIRRFHEAGIDVLYCFANAGVLPFDKRHLVVKDPTEWQKHIAEVVTSVRGEVAAYEILNEPNARSGMGKNPDPETYDLLTPETDAWCIERAAEAIRRHDPGALVAGPTTCHTDVGWTLDVLSRGAAKHLDILTEHPYFSLPEAPDYRNMVEVLVREGSRMKGRRMPCWATERGKRTPSNPEDGRIYPVDAKSAASIVRTMIIGFAGGSERFFDFQLCSFNSMFQYTSNHNGNPDNDYMARPSCLPYAERALMDLIEEAPCVKELPVGFASRAYVFDRGDRRVVALWKFLGDPVRIKLPAEALVCDFMGTPSWTDEITLDAFPQYIVTKATPERLANAFAALDFGPREAPSEAWRERLEVPFFEGEVDWSRAAVVPGRAAEGQVPMDAGGWGGVAARPGDSLEVRLAWNRTGLMMRAVVEKDGFHPQGDTAANTWKGDGLQVAFDTLRNAVEAAKGFDDDDFEYDLALRDGAPMVFRRRASLAYHDSLTKPCGVIDDVALDIVRDGRKTIYTAKFSPMSVSPFRLNEGESMRLAVLANLCDGRTRYGALETAPGILVKGKWPYGFQEIVLVGGDR